mmetsp:Transcript_10985/g.31529  ORF Transcript_10985/g.31529 Transcript_10985/m.31529 type:complete len:248 (-) Transcript_10985:993-1736(-)
MVRLPSLEAQCLELLHLLLRDAAPLACIETLDLRLDLLGPFGERVSFGEDLGAGASDVILELLEALVKGEMLQRESDGLQPLLLLLRHCGRVPVPKVPVLRLLLGDEATQFHQLGVLAALLLGDVEIAVVLFGVRLQFGKRVLPSQTRLSEHALVCGQVEIDLLHHRFLVDAERAFGVRRNDAAGGFPFAEEPALVVGPNLQLLQFIKREHGGASRHSRLWLLRRVCRRISGRLLDLRGIGISIRAT